MPLRAIREYSVYLRKFFAKMASQIITNPNAKINLGLNIVGILDNGYHALETVFYPVGIRDRLEIEVMEQGNPEGETCEISLSGIGIKGEGKDNLVVKAYKMLASDYDLPPIRIRLYKGIPTEAGMGGGSSDCAHMIKMLNQLFSLGISDEEMMKMAARLGADCPFFILDKPAYAEGIGEKLSPISLDLGGYFIGIVKPNISVSTREAFSLVTPSKPEINCRDIVAKPIGTWKNLLKNDFEKSVFALHPEIGHIKEKLYDLGALYASMSGSGSVVYGIFPKPLDLSVHFPKGFSCFCTAL